MIEGNTTYKLNQEDLATRAIRLLEEWGRYQRQHEPGHTIGWPSQTVESRMMDQWADDKRSRKEARKHWGRKRRTVGLTDPDGTHRKVAAIPMNEGAGKESRKGGKVPEQWPEHVQVVDKMIARMPEQLIRVTKAYYISQVSIREVADWERVSKAKAEQLLDRARFYFGAQMVLDPLLSGQDSP